MEKVIDRRAYRRNTISVREEPKEKLEHLEKKIKKVLCQLLIAVLLFFFISIAKLYKIEEVVKWVNLNINKEMDLKSMYEYGQNKIIELVKYIDKIEQLQIQNNIVIKQESEDDSRGMNEENTEGLVSNETMFEEAVEGVNQLIEDAQYIKEKYKLNHPITGTVTSVFGVRESDNKIVTPYHSGIDVAANKGTNIYAAIGGEVITATTDNAYGKYIMVKTDEVVTVYAHCSELKVQKGQKIKQGELIGKVGSTGWSTGPHLHFEIRLDGRLVNPADVLDYSKMGEK